MAIISITGNDIIKELGFKSTHKIDIVNVLAIIITFGSDILKMLGFNTSENTVLKSVCNPYDLSVFFFVEFVGDLYIAASARSRDI